MYVYIYMYTYSQMFNNVHTGLQTLNMPFVHAVSENIKIGISTSIFIYAYVNIHAHTFIYVPSKLIFIRTSKDKYF